MKKLVFVLFLSAVLLAGCKQEAPVAAPVPTAPAPTGIPSVEPGQMLTPQEAQSIALEHAGFTEEEVVGLHATIEIEDGIPFYEVEFRNGHIEYEYHIHGESGKVLSVERDH